MNIQQLRQDPSNTLIVKGYTWYFYKDLMVRDMSGIPKDYGYVYYTNIGGQEIVISESYHRNTLVAKIFGIEHVLETLDFKEACEQVIDLVHTKINLMVKDMVSKQVGSILEYMQPLDEEYTKVIEEHFWEMV